MNKYLKRAAALVAAAAIAFSAQGAAFADTFKETKTSAVFALSKNSFSDLWENISGASQFTNNKGNFCFAYDNGDNVTIVRTNSKGQALKKRITLKKRHPLFGAVTCDKQGNYYLVTGENNDSDDASVNTMFIAKYTSSGKFIKEVGDNGSSSLDYYYGEKYYTMHPFENGGCSVAINGDILAANYARQMYSKHQSNSIFAINIKTMEKVSGIIEYNSHSVAQRTVPYKDGFLFASEGDSYPRAFNVTTYTGGKSKENEVFHFAYTGKETLVDNYASMGGIAVIGNKCVLVGTSVKSLNSRADSETQQLFIQIFDPTKDLSSAKAYTTIGVRSGFSGNTGSTAVTDYGVRWLTAFPDTTEIVNPQVVATKNRIVVLYEKYVDNKYKGVYYMVLNQNGKILQKSKRFSADATLNHGVMPVVSNGKICWVGNLYSERFAKTKNLYINCLTIDV